MQTTNKVQMIGSNICQYTTIHINTISYMQPADTRHSITQPAASWIHQSTSSKLELKIKFRLSQPAARWN